MDVNNYILHLNELRTRVIRCSAVVLLLFLGLFLIDEVLYVFIARPLLTHLPIGNSIIATEVTATFMVPMKLALISAIFLAIPYLLYQLWSFVAPALYSNEKKQILPFLISSTFLFYGGVIFAFYIICPMALSFFAKCAPPGVAVMADIKAYLDFVLTILFAGGLAFQVPIITLALIQSGIISIQQFEYFRPYVIVVAFILGMLLTPPDVVSQILLALPMWWLFEVGLLIAKYREKGTDLLSYHSNTK